MINMHQLVGKHDILLITLDTLRFDVAQQELAAGRLPNLNQYIDQWQQRHAPGSFTYASHHAIFAGFFPTPIDNPAAPRLFALSFPGSETTGKNTYVFDAPNIIAGLESVGYHTVCIGGVGFFNKQTPLGNQFPHMFIESYWDSGTGVTDPNSTKNQVDLILRLLKRQLEQPLFLFLNISALHQPNCFYLEGCQQDNLKSHAAALRYVDNELGRLFSQWRNRPAFVILCSDHGTAYGEQGYQGHRLAHEVVWTVPYAEFTIGEAY